MLSFRPLNVAVPKVVLALAPAILTILAGGCDRETGQQAQPPAAATDAAAPKPKAAPAQAFDRMYQGTALPDLTFKNPAGKALRLGDLKGPVLINLWATWCAPCVTELPQLDQLAAGGDLRVVTVSQDMEGGAKVAEFLKDKGIARLEPWLDPENTLMEHYGSGTLPTTVLYDAKGREVWRLIGEHDWTSPETAKLLAEAG